MASDLQDPPELIPEFIDRWERGYENVYGVITTRSGEGIMRKLGAAFFYRVINALSETPVPRNASDFRLVDRKAYLAFNALPEKNRMVRAMWGFIGFRSCGVEHVRAARLRGTSSYRWGAIIDFALRAVLSYSYLPLKLIPFFGIACAIMSFVLLVGFAVRAVFFGVPFDGFGTLISLLLLLFGFLFLFLGVTSEYVGMTYTETRQRPTYIVRTVLGGAAHQEADSGLAGPVVGDRAFDSVAEVDRAPNAEFAGDP
jgi:dolichol-phosphate mannosyltransferase